MPEGSKSDTEVLMGLIIALNDSFEKFKENVTCKFDNLLADNQMRKEMHCNSLLRSDVCLANNFSSSGEENGVRGNLLTPRCAVPDAKFSPSFKFEGSEPPSVEFKRRSDAMDAVWLSSKPEDVVGLMNDEVFFLNVLETHHLELFKLRNLFCDEDAVLSSENGDLLRELELSSLKGVDAPKFRQVLKAFCYRLFNEYTPHVTGGNYARYKERTVSVAKYVCQFLFGKKKDNSIRTNYTRLVIINGVEKAKPVEHLINEKSISTMIRKFQKNKGGARTVRFRALILVDEVAGLIPSGFFGDMPVVKNEMKSSDSSEEGGDDADEEESSPSRKVRTGKNTNNSDNLSNNKENVTPLRPCATGRPDMAGGPSLEKLIRSQNTQWHRSSKATKVDTNDSPSSIVKLSPVIQGWDNQAAEDKL